MSIEKEQRERVRKRLSARPSGRNTTVIFVLLYHVGEVLILAGDAALGGCRCRFRSCRCSCRQGRRCVVDVAGSSAVVVVAVAVVIVAKREMLSNRDTVNEWTARTAKATLLSREKRL